MYRSQERLHALSMQGPLKGCVVGAEFVRNIEQWIAAADVVCVPHTRPHFSRTIAEAGAMKKPVVGSRVGGIEEVVDDGASGFLVPPRDEAALAMQVAKLLSEDGLAAELGARGYELAVERYDPARCADAVLRVYSDILPGHCYGGAA